MAEGSGMKARGALVRIGLPALLAGALLAGGGWMLASQQSAEAAPARPATGAPTRYDRVFGNIYYKVPAGYRAVQTEGGVIMVPEADLAAGEGGRYFLITPGLKINDAIRAKMREGRKGLETAVTAFAIVAGNLAEDPGLKLSNPESCNSPDQEGYSCFAIASVSTDKDAGGATRYSQYVILLTADRADIIMRVAYNSKDRYDALLDPFNALVTSTEPKNSKAPPPTRLAPALPTDLAAITPKPKPAPRQSNGAAAGRPGGGGHNCGVTQYRQQCSYVGAGPYANYSCLPVPYTPAGC